MVPIYFCIWFLALILRCLALFLAQIFLYFNRLESDIIVTIWGHFVGFLISHDMIVVSNFYYLPKFHPVTRHTFCRPSSRWSGGTIVFRLTFYEFLLNFFTFLPTFSPLRDRGVTPSLPTIYFSSCLMSTSMLHWCFSPSLGYDITSSSSLCPSY